MFDLNQLPFLVHLVRLEQSSLFPAEEGYNTNAYKDGQVMISFRDGWTFPLSVDRQQKLAQQNGSIQVPLLLVKNDGRLPAMTGGADLARGYARQFCRLDGTEPEYFSCDEVFHGPPGVHWMLVKDSVARISLQYGYKDETLSDGSIRCHYHGLLRIQEFNVRTVIAPRTGRYADTDVSAAKLHFAEGRQIIKRDWAFDGEAPKQYILEQLAAANLNRYREQVLKAYSRASEM